MFLKTIIFSLVISEKGVSTRDKPKRLPHSWIILNGLGVGGRFSVKGKTLNLGPETSTVNQTMIVKNHHCGFLGSWLVFFLFLSKKIKRNYA